MLVAATLNQQQAAMMESRRLQQLAMERTIMQHLLCSEVQGLEAALAAALEGGGAPAVVQRVLGASSTAECRQIEVGLQGIR